MTYLDLINHLLSNLGTIFVLGILHTILLERELIVSFIKQDKKRKVHGLAYFKPVYRRLYYVVGGMFLTLLAWQCTISLLNFIYPSNMVQPGNSTHAFVNIVRSWQGSLSGIAVYGFILSSFALSLSAGSRWLVNVAKILATVTILLVFSLALIAALP